jgi:hypothetical protein
MAVVSDVSGSWNRSAEELRGVRSVDYFDVVDRKIERGPTPSSFGISG